MHSTYNFEFLEQQVNRSRPKSGPVDMCDVLSIATINFVIDVLKIPSGQEIGGRK